MSGEGRGRLTPERLLALAGVTGLMIVGLACLGLIAGVGGDDHAPPALAGAPAESTPTPTPEPTPTPAPTPEPLTRGERAARRAAAEVVRSRGFEVVRLRDYVPDRKLRVLLGRDAAGARRAFFFVEDAYIGNDASEVSARLRVRGGRERQVTLGYGVYAPGDEPCCPTGGPVDVRFRWDGAALAPRDPIPPPQQRTPAYQPAS